METLTTEEIIIAIVMSVLSIVFLWHYFLPLLKLPFLAHEDKKRRKDQNR